MEESKKVDIIDVANYVILKASETKTRLSLFKLHKILYYIQSWYLVYHEEPLFDDEFQAWVHGPVSKKVQDEFRRGMYEKVLPKDVANDYKTKMNEEQSNFLNLVFNTYMGCNDTQLELMVHSETPWIEARKGCKITERCTNVINKESMKEYYGARVGKNKT